jgi:TRAP-type mannitol/chloroaromatic compound transport system permease large subunit
MVLWNWSKKMDILVLLGSFTLLCALGLPVAYALGLSAILGALWIDLPLEAIMLKISDGTDDFSLLAIPFFVLAVLLTEPKYSSDLFAAGWHWSTYWLRPCLVVFLAPQSQTHRQLVR